MCGIVGYIGKEEKNLSILLESLKKLEYRGYDSSGIAYLKDNEIKIIKEEGKISSLEKLVDKQEKSYMGIGHTRWATHGQPNSINAHPHKFKHITLVHNGIIENADLLKEEFLKRGFVFKSQTDTEVISVLLNCLYEETNDMKKTLLDTMNILKGSYALGIICDEDKDSLYAIKKESPLIIGLNKSDNFIASDILAIKKLATDYIILDDFELAIVGKTNVSIYDKEGIEIKKDVQMYKNQGINEGIKEYEHYMLKEINEQPCVIDNLYQDYINSFNELSKKLPDFSKYNHIDIVACGSAYHAGLVGKYYLEENANIPITVHLASEYRYGKLFPNNKTLVILVSQSGETADTLAALKIAKLNSMDTLAIVNVPFSTIAREADYVFFTKAGEEIAVATTKAYSAQIVAFIIISYVMSNKKINIEEYQRNLSIWQTKMKELIDKDYKKIIDILKDNNSNFFMGRQIDYALAMEGSLKLKEITYINSVSYPAGELKHGTISLVDKDFPIIAVITDKQIADKTFSNLKEVKARGAKVIVIISEELDNNFDFIDEKIVIPTVSNLIKPIMTIIPLQMIAYKLAYELKRDIDKPRNLAKSVTVE